MSALQLGLLRVWTARGPWAWLLWPLSQVFAFLLVLRKFAYRWGWRDTVKLPVPVIVVGNVVVGGAGKTPIVMALVRHLQARGLHPGVIARGHGRASHESMLVTPDSAALEVGDEPLLIARLCRVPVAVSRHRPDAAQLLLVAHPEVDVILSDDGLQHLALARDIEVCVFDDRGTGNGMLLPAGPLREPWPRAVDFVLHTGAQPAFSGFRATRRLALEAVNAHGERRPLSNFAKLDAAPMVALAGIAHPERFFDMLRAAGISLDRTMALPDHYAFEPDFLASVLQDTLLCTEKDAVKLWMLWPHVWAVPLVVEIDPDFLAQMDRQLGAKLSLRHGPQTA